MERVEDPLAAAERLIREGEDRVVRLEELVAEMARGGHHDAARIGRGLLEGFQRSLATFREALEARRRAVRNSGAPG